MTPAFEDVHTQVEQQVQAAMTAAMRADPLVLGRCAETLGADLHSRDLVREARGLVLACGAALTAVLAVHRPGKDAHGDGACRACGTRHCPTLRGISDALAAYALRPAPTDQPEADGPPR
ncbi:hypothetical protein [Actinomadura sp. SCN-SB]|uniref:hypothetical protein n=1 Tax=Actinomadura sp. SCN-SB TaxID=3373092 RepID=UPI0037519EF3